MQSLVLVSLLTWTLNGLIEALLVSVFMFTDMKTLILLVSEMFPFLIWKSAPPPKNLTYQSGSTNQAAADVTV